MNTFKAVWINPEGEVFYIEDCPEEPKSSDYSWMTKWAKDYGNYQSALSEAKKNAVRFADQEAGFLLAWKADDFKYNYLHSFVAHLKINGYDTLYPLPTGIEVEICGLLPSDGGLAYIKSSSEKPVESQEELWREVVKVINGKYRIGEERMKELQKHFSITRKEP